MAVRKVEEDRLWAGAVAAALAECRWYLGQPGRYVPVPDTACSCCDPLVARELLEDVLRWLPRGARTDLERLVSRLDDDFECRTVPRPASWLPSPWGAGIWWRQRLLEL
ncbi:hypothetical protein [Kitasatospora sp. GP82]|uniref:hypothetical protein n=1 Tax=Kitasatospora sp. GP82 TaxID=3035089 RepID=UPI002475669B|nr:hypothetical protein [Kitasatospora sp. GP82]